jgi:hypothetical protein
MIFNLCIIHIDTLYYLLACLIGIVAATHFGCFVIFIITSPFLYKGQGDEFVFGFSCSSIFIKLNKGNSFSFFLLVSLVSTERYRF